MQRTGPLLPEVLAEHLGVLVWEPMDIEGLSQQTCDVLLKREKRCWSAVTLSYADIYVVIYNSSHSQARQASDIMHELSHILIGHESSKIVVFQDGTIFLRTYDQSQEEEASWLANCLLLPRDALLFIGRTNMNRVEACKAYGVSQHLLNYRMNISGVNYQIKAEKYQ